MTVRPPVTGGASDSVQLEGSRLPRVKIAEKLHFVQRRHRRRRAPDGRRAGPGLRLRRRSCCRPCHERTRISLRRGVAHIPRAAPRGVAHFSKPHPPRPRPRISSLPLALSLPLAPSLSRTLLLVAVLSLSLTISRSLSVFLSLQSAPPTLCPHPHPHPHSPLVRQTTGLQGCSCLEPRRSDSDPSQGRVTATSIRLGARSGAPRRQAARGARPHTRALARACREPTVTSTERGVNLPIFPFRCCC